MTGPSTKQGVRPDPIVEIGPQPSGSAHVFWVSAAVQVFHTREALTISVQMCVFWVKIKTISVSFRYFFMRANLAFCMWCGWEVKVRADELFVGVRRTLETHKPDEKKAVYVDMFQLVPLPSPRYTRQVILICAVGLSGSETHSFINFGGL